jgi:photosystem II stability/assembly factor-like uncharacterized protein
MPNRRPALLFALLLATLSCAGPMGRAQDRSDAAQPEPFERLYDGLKWRHIGPFRGGRVAAVAGIPSDRDTYYFGACGGGVWKTTDAGKTWKCVSDGHFGGSIGAVAVSEWDPNVIYVGGGEKTVRGNVSHGDGMYKSVDAGKTWTRIGLEDTRHIPRIRVHPKNPDLVYVAALGHLFGPSDQRGVYRSKDGGKTWERILFVSDRAGAVDLALDPTNPRILYASIWQVLRTPYSLESGGPDSGLYKSVDGGDTWTKLHDKKGMPKGTLGIVGVAPANPDRVYAIVEAEEGGVFRSDDGGETWTRANSDRSMRQRAWYYTRIYVDPRNPDVVYVPNVAFHKSEDGGRTFKTIRTPHADNHDLWIDPNDPKRMIEGNDGGANVSFDGGETWSAQDNQPTAQFYRVTTDNHFPYRIYGAQQDNSTVRIVSRSDGRAIGERDWEPTAGSESGWLAPDPRDPEIVFGGNYGGHLSMQNHRTRQSRNVTVWPDNPMGHGAADLRHRFQWNFPILFSRHEPNTLYAAGNVLFRTRNGGQSWEAISPDLTRDDKSRQGPSGGPITKDNTSVEYYGTIFALAESAREPGAIWCGSDDGLVHVTRDGGANWANVTPPTLPEWAQINSIEPHPFEPGGLYVAATRYKSDDFEPYLYKTVDFGKTWTRIDRGIPRSEFTRVVRADPERRGLLFAGTERGAHVSFDDGASWRPLQFNLPVVPITDLAVKEGDLIAATQGRSFWVLDDLTPLRQASAEFLAKPAHLYPPRPAHRLRGGRGGGGATRGDNPPAGPVLDFVLSRLTDKTEVKLEIRDGSGATVRSFSNKGPRRDRFEVREGMNRFAWDMQYPGAKGFEGLVLWAAGLGGPTAPPGRYEARLKVDDWQAAVDFEILPDPRADTTPDDYRLQFEFLLAVRDKLTETHEAIQRIRGVREQIQTLKKRLGAKRDDLKALFEKADSMVKRMTEIEEALYQTKNRSGQDPLNYPIRLNNRLAALSDVVGRGPYRPTDQAEAVRVEVTALIDAELAKLRPILEEELPTLNRLAAETGVPAIVPPEPADEPEERGDRGGGGGEQDDR